MKYIDCREGCGRFQRRALQLSPTWLSIGALIRLSVAMMVLAGVWLMVAWAVVLP